MSTVSLRTPQLGELADFISSAYASQDVVTIFATCSVRYTGKREGKIGKGDRVIICKGDGAIAVHRPTGAQAVARQGIQSSLEPILRDDCLRIYSARGSIESIRVDITRASLAVRYKATDEATLHENQTEEQMHEFIKAYPETIEEGFRILEHEHQTPHGRVDFYGADSDGNNVILEVKRPAAELTHVDQLQRYVSYFRQSKVASIRGILVAPEFKNKVKQTLHDSQLEWVHLDEYKRKNVRPGQTLMDDWS